MIPCLGIGMDRTKHILAGFLACCTVVYAYDEVVVFPREKGGEIDTFFYDLKSPAAPRKFVENGWAETLLEEYGFNGLRTSIYGTGKKPAHPAPGVVLEEYYEPETAALKLARKINPDTLIFASKKLDNTQSFPEWTKDARGVIPGKYAVLIIDYMEYMAREGLEIDVLGIDNERRFNEGNITPEKHHAIVVELRRLAKERGLEMPRIVGPEDYAVGRQDWMKRFSEMDSDTLDIFGTHYYPRARHLDRLKTDLAYAGGREKWHTELHWDAHGDPEGSTHSMESAVCAFLALWDCVDCGMNGFSWWDFNPAGKRRDYLMHAASVPLVGAWPVKVVDPDGGGTADEMQLHTRAFLQGDTLTVYALNLDPERRWKGLRIRLASGRIIGSVEGRQWADGYPPEGKSGKLRPYNSRIIRVDIAPRTINVFQFKVRP